MNTFEKFLALWNAIPRQKAPDKEGDWEEKTVRVDVKTKEDFSFGINDVMSNGMFTETPDDMTSRMNAASMTLSLISATILK